MDIENYCTKHGLERDLRQAECALETIVQIGDTVRINVHDILKRQGYDAEILLVGSTNPDRLTTVIDPMSPDDRYLCDFDVAVILPHAITVAEKERLLALIFPDGKTKNVFGRLERSTSIQKCLASIAICTEEEASTHTPIVYTRKFSRFTKEEAHDIRALRLFTNRNGLYGGFTRGFKGIALEQLVHAHGGFEGALEAIYRSLQHCACTTPTEEPLTVKSPIDGKNLVGNLQQDIICRTHHATELAITRGLYKMTPYTIVDWNREHPGALTVRLESDNDDPYETYKITERLVRRTLGTLGITARYATLVIPHRANQEALLAVPLFEENQRASFRRIFQRRWDSI